MSTQRYRFGFDIGGTFTDFVLVDVVSGEIRSYKTLTTPRQPARAVLEGLHQLLGEANAAGSEVVSAIHGTTLITNALIERKGAVTILLTTRGFSDVLDTQREMRYDIYDLHAPPVTHLVPRPLRFEIDERLDGLGNELEPLDVTSLEQLSETLEKAGVTDRIEAIAVCFLHAYANPAHEQAACDWLKARFPQAAISASSAVAPEIREYERMSTTVCNAYVQPLTERYLARLYRELTQAGLEKDLYLMLSSGGITTLKTAGEYPVRMIESGPAAGVLAAVFYGEMLGESNLVSFDMGGTTAKMCVIEDGRPAMADNFEVARVHRFKRGSGLPVRVPTIELIEIGAGGGSIAYVDELGLLKVGPESSGADPGPACYGQGGDQPTVTDADLLLGYLNPHYFLGGRITLDRDAAARAVERRVAEPLGVSITQAAAGIYQVVNENMISATRVHVAERGVDPRGLKLIAFGGAGPVHAYPIARALKMQGYICPPGAGVTSALGFLTAPVAFDFVRTFIAQIKPTTLAEMDEIYAELEAQGRSTLLKAGIPAQEIEFTRSADLRHMGQGHEISVVLPYARLADVDLDEELRPFFYAHYADIYGYAHRHLGVEVTACRLRASGPVPHIRLSNPDMSDDAVAPDLSAARALKETRAVYFDELNDFVETPVYDRHRLIVGMRIAGPAVVEEQNSTAVIGPSATAVVDKTANLVVILDYSE
ncbi:MAG: hydantoinase/oxoprolinase family protein [Caldilineaceae bacterium]|nr:hydantoinase/oxoprolinase family protein [Caldilineaceae bacterium]